MTDSRQPTKHHPLYGDIPLVEKQSTYNGREYKWREYDPDFQPPLPKGAVRGEPHKQMYCCDPPKYFYVDEPRTCIQCKQPFVFGAKEQKYWFETLKFNFGSHAIRCVSCRKKRRSEDALRQTLARVLKDLESKPRDPQLLLELARTTIDYRERTGQGDLDRAIAACRLARDEHPVPESLYWEGRCQELAGRSAKAKACFTQFLEAVEGIGKYNALVRSLSP